MTVATAPSQRPVARFGSFEFDQQIGELRKHGLRIKLQQKPMQVLAILLEKPGSIVSREELQRRLWPDGIFVDFDHSLNTAIKKLRDAVGDTAVTPRYIATVDRQGYRFVAPVSIVDALAQTAAIDSRNAITSAGQTPPIRKASKWLPWLRPALALLLVSTAISGVLYYRSVRASRLTGNDTILIADFTNSTGEQVFDDALKQALTISLRQSPFLDIAPQGKITSALKDMTQPAATPVTGDVAQQVCQRVGSKAYIQGAIASLGSDYVIGLKAINCLNGNVLASQQVTANSKEKVIPALGAAAAKLRHEVGESLASVQQYDVPLVQATTPSLEALKTFSTGMEVFNGSKYLDAIPLFKHAIELDPNFAMAYESLAWSYAASSQAEEGARWMKQAYVLRDHASELEKLLITTAYYNVVTHETDKRIETLELMRRLYPRNFAVTNNLGSEYVDAGRLEDALPLAQETLRLAPNVHNPYEELGVTYIALNRFSDAKTVRQKEIDRKLDYHWDHVDLYNIAFWENDTHAMQREISWAKGKPYEFFMLQAEANDDAAVGKWKEARQRFQEGIESARRQPNFKSVSLELEVERDLNMALLGVNGTFSKTTQDVVRAGGNRNATRWAAFAHATSGDTGRARLLADELLKRDPEGTFANKVWVPVIRAEIELQEGRPSDAIAALQSTTPYEFGWKTANWSNFVRGRAYLKLGNAAAASTEFQKVLDHKGICLSDPPAAMVYMRSMLDLARARVAMHDVAGAKAAYQQLLQFWKDADPDLPPLKEAKAELAHLQ